MTAYQCPFCGLSLAMSQDTYANYFLNFHDVTKFKNNAAIWKRDNLTSIKVAFIKCPNCKKVSIYAFGHSKDLDGLSVNIHPRVNYTKYPGYIPEQITADYQEACSVLEFSERAAAALARRCLRGIIRDYWEISKSTLYEEIRALREFVDAELWQAIDSISQLGGIGERMKQADGLLLDVDPQEAHRLLKLVELLLKEWYIARHNREAIFEEIVNIDLDG
ncbi:MAG: DUF4145 domain-containing protein [Acidaminococcales bacterium]|nr:DUF4145 domain-containing protein [Acidaminococcales bacterium]